MSHGHMPSDSGVESSADIHGSWSNGCGDDSSWESTRRLRRMG